VPRLPTLTPRDEREKEVIDVWRSGGLGWGTIAVYLGWVRRWRAHWRARRADDTRHLTLADVLRFASTLIGPRCHRRVGPACRAAARNSLHAWSTGLQKLGVVVPCWRAVLPAKPLPALLQSYVEHRQSHRGVGPRSLERDVDVATDFLEVLRVRRRAIATMRIAEIDAFVDGLLGSLAPATAADRCSSLRAFLRFLRATGRLRRDLATAVVGPRVRVAARPPRALPWSDIRRILQAIPRQRRVDVRDYAMLLLLASYGMGCAEVAQLRLDDINWAARVLRVHRPKTSAVIELPLMPAVARALAAYLRRARPSHSAAREVFLTIGMPHRPVTASAVRHQVRKHAAAAGIAREFRGAHVFRHSHATRQIDLGARPKIVSDILGHRRPASTSVYVRVAVRRLRALALPVPR
jgi:integrase/recombinase XerD